MFVSREEIYWPMADQDAVASRMLDAFTLGLPMKTIELEGVPYLERFHVARTQRYDVWLHHFLSADGDRSVHNHPFIAQSIILTGGYVEDIEVSGEIVERRRGREERGDRDSLSVTSAFLSWFSRYCPTEDQSHFPGTGERITPFTWHRIKSVLPNTWTVMIVEHARLPMWYIKQGDDLVGMEGSPADWWKDAATKTECGL